MADRQNNSRTPASVETRILTCIQKLIDLSKALREAITQRSADKVWDILSLQEEQAMMLEQYSKVWHDMQQCTASEDPEKEQLRKQIRTDIQKVKAMQQSNSMLAQSFLSAIRKAIDSLSAGSGQKKTKVYNQRGRVGSKGPSRIIRQLG